MQDFKTLILDFQNTLYEEIFEYGPAMEAALSIWQNAHPALDLETLYNEMSHAFADLGSDWDMRVWEQCPSLTALENFDVLAQESTQIFTQTAREKTIENTYDNVLETLETLKNQGITIIIVTEAVAHAAAERLSWAGIDTFADHVYAWPGTDQTIAPLKCPLSFFPSDSDSFYKKPHAFILGQALADLARQPFDSLFESETVDDWRIAEIPETHAIQNALCTKLLPKSEEAKHLLDETLYVGDSFYRDGAMARNAGIRFAHAGYGKKIDPKKQSDHTRYRDLLYAVSGWDKEILKLAHEAQKNDKIANVPCERTLDSFGDLLK